MKYTSDRPLRSEKFLIIDFHKHTLKNFDSLPHRFGYVNHPNELADMLNLLETQIDKRKQAVEQGYQNDRLHFDQAAAIRHMGYLVVVIDDYAEMMQNCSEEQLEKLTQCVDTGKEFGVRLIFTEETSFFTRTDDLFKLASNFGCGVLLGGSENLDLFNDAKATGPKTYNLPPGRGYVVNQRRSLFFQAAAFHNQDEDPKEALERRIQDLCR